MGEDDYQGPAPRRGEPPLTDAEIRETRELLEADRRVKWFWAMSRRVAVWTAAAFGALAVTWDAVVRAIRHLAGL